MVDTNKRKKMLEMMIKIRAFEEKLEELYQKKAMFGSTHSYRGQEAIAAGVCSALESTDMFASYHRGTGHLVAKGADLYLLMCEVMGRADGYSKGARRKDAHGGPLVRIYRQHGYSRRHGTHRYRIRFSGHAQGH